MDNYLVRGGVTDGPGSFRVKPRVIQAGIKAAIDKVVGNKAIRKAVQQVYSASKKHGASLGYGAAGAGLYNTFNEVTKDAANMRKRSRSGNWSSKSKRSRKSHPVTAQRDFVSTGRLRGKRRLSKYARRKVKRFKRKVRRALKLPNFKINFEQNFGRSWKGKPNEQTWCAFPMPGYRGATASTASIALGAAGSNVCTLRNDAIEIIKNEFNNKMLYPANVAANAAMADWWFKVKRVTLDLTMTNVGTSATSDATDCAIEYDLYWVSARRGIEMQDPVLLNTISDWQTRVRRDAIAYHNAGLQGIVPVGSNAFEPWLEPAMGKYFKWSKLGTGYLKATESVRIKKSVKVKKLFSRRQWDDEEADTVTSLGIAPGVGGFMFVCMRGTPATGSATGVSRAPRAVFMANYNYYCSFPGQNQRGYNTGALTINDYA